jgi:Ca-activated chloride channel homolog
MTKYFLIILSLLLSVQTFSQTDRSLVRKGNREYNENQFNKAEVLYKKSLLKTPTFPQANYNLGNTYYKQKRYDKAIEQYMKVIPNLKDKKIGAQTYHNLGNSFLEKYKTENDQQKKSQCLDNSIRAYKNALINSPKDKDTKYNLSYALALKRLLQQQQQQQKQNQQKQQQKQNQQQKPKEEKKQELTKEEAEKLLQAIRAQENNVQERLNKKEEKNKVKIEKEW